MDLNVLSELTSSADVQKTSVGTEATDSGFEAVYKAEQPAEQTPKAAKNETFGAEQQDAVTPSDVSTPEERQNSAAGDDETWFADDARLLGKSRTNDDIAAHGTFVAGVTETEIAKITSGTAPRTSNLGGDIATAGTQPVNAAQVSQTADTSTLGYSGKEPIANTDNALPASHIVNGSKQTDVLTGLSGTKDTQTSVRSGAVALPAALAQSNGPSTGTDVTNVNVTVSTSTAQTKIDQTVADPTGQLPVDADVAPVKSSTDKLITPPGLTLLERHLGGHSVRLPVEQLQTSFAFRDFSPDGRQPTPGMTPPPSATAMLAAMNGAAPVSLGPASTGHTGSARGHSAARFVTDLHASIASGEAPQEAVGEIRQNTALVATNLGVTSIPARADLAASVAHQMANAMRSAADKQVEIALSPAELGRVRMILSPSDMGVTMSILADRPETLELMRRNIDELARSFADLGYEDISFSFGQNDQMTDDATQQMPDQGDQTETLAEWADTAAIPTDSTSRLTITPDGIDMRL